MSLLVYDRLAVIGSLARLTFGVQLVIRLLDPSLANTLDRLFTGNGSRVISPGLATLSVVGANGTHNKTYCDND